MLSAGKIRYRLFVFVLLGMFSITHLGYSDEGGNLANLTIKLKSIDFLGTGNHTLEKQGTDSWDNDKFANNGDTTIDYAEWQDNNLDGTATDGNGEKNEPVCYTMVTSPEMNAVINVAPSDAAAANGTLRISLGAQQIYTGSVPLSGGDNPASGLGWTLSLANYVNNTDFTLTWEISVNGGAFFTIGTTTTKFFVTYGPPTGSTLTAKRIDCVTEQCKDLGSGENAEPDMLDKLWEKVDEEGNYKLGSETQFPWMVFDGETGECILLAELFELTMKMVGISLGSGSVVYLYVDKDGGSHESSSYSTGYATRNCQVGQSGHTETIGPTHSQINSHERLIFEDKGIGPGNHLNNWEACYKYRHKVSDPWAWYAPGTQSKFASVQDCMNSICKRTFWIYQMSPTGWGICIDPGDAPEHIW